MYQEKIDMPFSFIVKTTLPRLDVTLGTTGRVEKQVSGTAQMVEESTTSSVAWSRGEMQSREKQVYISVRNFPTATWTAFAA